MKRYGIPFNDTRAVESIVEEIFQYHKEVHTKNSIQINFGNNINSSVVRVSKCQNYLRLAANNEKQNWLNDIMEALGVTGKEKKHSGELIGLPFKASSAQRNSS